MGHGKETCWHIQLIDISAVIMKIWWPNDCSFAIWVNVDVLVSLCGRFILWPFSFVAVLDVHRHWRESALEMNTAREHGYCTASLYNFIRIA